MGYDRESHQVCIFVLKLVINVRILRNVHTLLYWKLGLKNIASKSLIYNLPTFLLMLCNVVLNHS